MNKTMRFMKLVFCLTLMLSALSGCGFHLRGDEPLPPQLKIIYLQSANPYDPFIISVRNILISRGIRVVDNQAEAPLTLQILSVNFNQALTNISPNTQVRTYSLSYTVLFQLKSAQNKVLLAPQTVTSITPYSTSDAQLLADSQVLTQQQQQMQSDIVIQVFNILNSQQGRAALAQVSS